MARNNKVIVASMVCFFYCSEKRQTMKRAVELQPVISAD